MNSASTSPAIISDEIVEILMTREGPMPVKDLYSTVQANLDLADWKPVKSARLLLTRYGVVRSFQEGRPWFIELATDYGTAYDKFLAMQQEVISGLDPIRTKVKLPSALYFHYVTALGKGEVEMIFVPRDSVVTVNGKELK